MIFGIGACHTWKHMFSNHAVSCMMMDLRFSISRLNTKRPIYGRVDRVALTRRIEAVYR
jgi:hypothetical protein